MPKYLAICCADEGVRLSGATRLGVAGAGHAIPHFAEMVAALNKTFSSQGVASESATDSTSDQSSENAQSEALARASGDEKGEVSDAASSAASDAASDKEKDTSFMTPIMVFASEENAWMRKQLSLDDWDSVNASMEQHVQALADQHGLDYGGVVAFVDPIDYAHKIKAHMVRPHGIHIAKRVVFTVGGGEHTFHLGSYVLSADWVHAVEPEIVEEILRIQLTHLEEIAKKPLEIVVDDRGDLSDDMKVKNVAVLKAIGLVS